MRIGDEVLEPVGGEHLLQPGAQPAVAAAVPPGGRRPLVARTVRALGQPDAARREAEVAAVRLDRGPELQVDRLVAREQGEVAVGGRAGDDLDVPVPLQLGERARDVAADPAVQYAEPNYIYKASAVPNDPRFADLWAMQNPNDADIDAVEAWDTQKGSRDVLVAIIDTGVDFNHEDLRDNMWRNPGETGGGKEANGVDDDGNGFVDDVFGWDFASNDKDPMDDNAHGSHVAGTIAATGDNRTGVVGVNWRASIMALKFLDASGSAAVDRGLVVLPAAGPDLVVAVLALHRHAGTAVDEADGVVARPAGQPHGTEGKLAHHLPAPAAPTVRRVGQQSTWRHGCKCRSASRPAQHFAARTPFDRRARDS